RVLARALLVLILWLRLEDAAHARSERRLALAGRTRVGTPLGFEELGLRVVRDVIAADLVRALAEQRAVEQLEEALLSVVLRALRHALVILVGAVALLAECERIAVRGRRHGVVGVLTQNHLVGMDGERTLRDDHAADERANLGLVIHIASVGLIMDR